MWLKANGGWWTRIEQLSLYARQDIYGPWLVLGDLFCRRTMIKNMGFLPFRARTKKAAADDLHRLTGHCCSRKGLTNFVLSNNKKLQPNVRDMDVYFLVHASRLNPCNRLKQFQREPNKPSGWSLARPRPTLQKCRKVPHWTPSGPDTEHR